MERLDKLISSQTNYSRKEVKKLVADGRVRIDDKIADKYDRKINEFNSSIFIDNKLLDIKKNIYLILNKPKGYVSATKDNKDLTVINLVPEEFSNRELFPVGRLDKDTTGLLILTDDGEFAHNITSPKKHVSKTYEVLVDIELTEDIVIKFKRGINLKDEKCMPAFLEIVDRNKGLVTINEGKYHQIKRMFGSVGAKVLELKRIRIGNYSLPNDMKEGEIRELNNEDLNQITKTD